MDSTEEIHLWEEDEYWVITHKPTGYTTQGNSRIHALLMLADALSSEYEAEKPTIELAKDVFVLTDEQQTFVNELSQTSHEE